jgi:hypothetical protein
MSCDSIYGFVSSITTSNVVWWDKNEKTTFQEGKVKKALLSGLDHPAIQQLWMRMLYNPKAAVGTADRHLSTLPNHRLGYPIDWLRMIL